MDKKDKEKLDGEIQNRGLSPAKIALYIGKYLDEEKAKSLIEAAERSDIEELLRIPIIALMLCILYDEEKQLPADPNKNHSANYPDIHQTSQGEGG